MVLGLLRETVSHACQALDFMYMGPMCACVIPLYRIVAKFNPTRLGSRNVFLVESHVPSPTVNVFEEYELLPAGASVGDGDIVELAYKMPR